MQKILNLLKQRRVWAALIGMLSFALTVLNINYKIDIPLLTDLMTALGGAMAELVVAGLALWSYMKPKK